MKAAYPMCLALVAAACRSTDARCAQALASAGPIWTDVLAAATSSLDRSGNCHEDASRMLEAPETVTPAALEALMDRCGAGPTMGWLVRLGPLVSKWQAEGSISGVGGLVAESRKALGLLAAEGFRAPDAERALGRVEAQCRGASGWE